MSDVPPDDNGLLQCGDLSAWPMTTLMEASVRTLMRVSSAVGASVDATLGRVEIDDAQAWRRRALRAQAEAGARGAARRLRKAAPNTLRVLELFLKEIELEQQRTR